MCHPKKKKKKKKKTKKNMEFYRILFTDRKKWEVRVVKMPFVRDLI